MRPRVPRTFCRCRQTSRGRGPFAAFVRLPFGLHLPHPITEVPMLPSSRPGLVRPIHDACLLTSASFPLHGIVSSPCFPARLKNQNEGLTAPAADLQVGCAAEGEPLAPLGRVDDRPARLAGRRCEREDSF